MPKRKLINSRDAKDSLCVNCRDSDVCPNLYASEYCIHSWDVRQIFEQSRDESSESIQKDYEVFKEKKRLYSHI